MDTQMKTSDALKLAFSKIDSLEKWTRGVYARDENLKVVEVSSEKATCFCSLGAIMRMQIDIKRKADLARWVAQQMIGNIAAFNDSKSYEEVAAAWKLAIAAAEAEEANHAGT